MLTYKNLIGNTISGTGDSTFSAQLLQGDAGEHQFIEATPTEIDQAVKLAAKAFETYRLKSPHEKAFFLIKIGELISASKADLVQTAMHETNLAQGRLEGEVQRAVNQLNLFAQLLKEGSWVRAIIDTAQADRKPLPKPDIRQMQIALGVVAVFGASNFPFAFSVAGGDTASALAAGCPVVYKSHPGHPATSEMVGALIIQAAKECNMPDGTFSLLQGTRNDVSIQLVTHQLIKAVGFTGSFAGGTALYQAAAKRAEPIPVYAEMGSTNPVFVLPNMLKENTDNLAQKLAASNLLSAGQFCTNPGIIVTLKGETNNQFLDRFAQHIEDAVAENMLTENIYKCYNSAVKKLLASGHVTIKAANDKEAAARLAAPHMFETNAKNFIDNKELWEEVFGPASIHVVAENEDELYAVANALPGQLTVSIWGNETDLQQYKNLATALELKAGRVIFNNVPTGVEVTHAMVHGGPFPATTDSKTTSVGTNAIYRFTRAVCYQNCPETLLPDALKNNNPLHVWRMVNGSYSNDVVA